MYDTLGAGFDGKLARVDDEQLVDSGVEVSHASNLRRG
jgi:hypothetical protein